MKSSRPLSWGNHNLVLLVSLFVVGCGGVAEKITVRSTGNSIPTVGSMSADVTPVPISDTLSPKESESMNEISTGNRQNQSLIAQTTEPTPMETARSSLELMTNGKVLDVWWSSDSAQLFYRLPGSTWRINLNDRSESELDPGYGVDSELTREALHLEHDNPLIVDLSPSGDRALIITEAGDDISEHTSSAAASDGENWEGGGQADVWIWKDGFSNRIGAVENCIGEAIWSLDEHIVIALAQPIPSFCLSSHAWLIFPSTGVIDPLFPTDEFTKRVAVYGMNPGSDRLLYSYDGELFLMDIGTKLADKVDVPLNSYGEWISDDYLLISYNRPFDQPGTPRAVGILALDTQILDDVLTPELFPELDDLWIRSATVSPDRRWLAFATGVNIYSMDSLWLLDIDPSG